MTHKNTDRSEALRIADLLEQCSLNSLLSPFMEVANELRRLCARIVELEDATDIAIERIAELEAQLSAIGAGGVEPLRKQAVQAEVPEAIEQMAHERYKVVPSHESMFHRWAVVAGNGTQQLYIGREVECLNLARKFTGAFLDGAFLAMQNTAPAHPKVSALSWSHALHDRDAALAAKAKQGGQPGWCDGCSPDNCCGCGIAADYSSPHTIKVVQPLQENNHE